MATCLQTAGCFPERRGFRGVEAARGAWYAASHSATRTSLLASPPKCSPPAPRVPRAAWTRLCSAGRAGPGAVTARCSAAAVGVSQMRNRCVVRPTPSRRQHANRRCARLGCHQRELRYTMYTTNAAIQHADGSRSVLPALIASGPKPQAMRKLVGSSSADELTAMGTSAVDLEATLSHQLAALRARRLCVSSPAACHTLRLVGALAPLVPRRRCTSLCCKGSPLLVPAARGPPPAAEWPPARLGWGFPELSLARMRTVWTRVWCWRTWCGRHDIIT